MIWLIAIPLSALAIALIAYAVVRVMQGLTYNGKDRK